MVDPGDGSDPDDPTIVTPVPAAPSPPLRRNPRTAVAVVVVAWVVVLAISAIPAIIGVLISGTVAPWLQLGQVAAVVALLLLSLLVPALRPLWRFAVVAGALLVFVAVSAQVDFEVRALQTLLGDTAFDHRMQAEQTAKLAVTIAMITLLLLVRLKPRDFFLTAGNLTAPIRPVRALGFPKPDSWRRFGLIWGFGIAAAIAVVETLILRPDASQWRALLPMIPAILVYAALNAFSEEMTYRVETRGLFWSWWIHFLSDVVIFCFIGMALVS